MAGRNMRVVLMMAVIFAVAVIAGGCGGGTPASKPVVYFDGKLHGDLAAAIAEQADLRAFNDTETDGPVIVSFTEGAPLDASTKAGLKAAYDAGQAVVIEHANESEVRDFLAAIGVSHAYAAPNQDDSARDKDVEIYAVMKTSGDVLVLCIHSDNDCAEGIEKEVTSADYDANEDDEIVSDDDDEEGGEKPTPPLEAEKNAERAKYLFEWIASKEAMASSLSGGKSNAASAAAGAQSAQDDIKQLDSAPSLYHLFVPRICHR
ncbi:MAG: hypothetical protein RRY12_12855 [Cloacibacillus sp.]